jgi:hypothetical protein
MEELLEGWKRWAGKLNVLQDSMTAWFSHGLYRINIVNFFKIKN